MHKPCRNQPTNLQWFKHARTATRHTVHSTTRTRHDTHNGQSHALPTNLEEGDLVAEAKGDAAGLSANADEAADLVLAPHLHAHVGQRVLAENRPRVQVRRQEARVAVQRPLGRQALRGCVGVEGSCSVR